MYNLSGWRQETDEMDAALPDARKFPAFQALVPKMGLHLGASSLVDLRSNCPPVDNQGQLGSCVAHAVVGSLEYLEILQHMSYTKLSRLFLYYNARLQTQDQNQDSGTYVSMAMQALGQEGSCPEVDWVYDESKVFIRPAWLAYQHGYAHRIVQSYKVMTTGQQRHTDIQTALANQHAVAFGTPVWNSIFSVGSDGNIPMPDSSAPAGGHALLIVGYDLSRGVYIIRNSWDVTWGDKGYGYMPLSYLDVAGADDFWVPTKYS